MKSAIKFTLIWTTFLFNIEVKAQSELSLSMAESIEIQKFLIERTLSQNEFYMRKLLPSMSLEVEKNRQDRVLAAQAELLFEIDNVVKAFKKTDDANKVEVFKNLYKQISGNLANSQGAAIDFVEGNPSAATARTALLIPRTGPTVTAENVLNTLSSYKRSAKPSDHVYEYETAEDLTQGSLKYTAGDDNSWLLENAPSPMAPNKDFAIKKCRQLLGWRCVTSLYRVAGAGRGADTVKWLSIFIYNLSENPDHADFAKDKRSINQISGSTAIYIVKESPKYVLIYGVDQQWNNDKLSFQKAIQSEFQKDFERFKKRLSSDLNINL